MQILSTTHKMISISIIADH